MEDEPFTNSPTANITINRDTVDLGTVIASELATTDTLKLFNRGDKGLRLSRVWLEKGAASPFRVNVDSSVLPDGEGGDCEILRHESLFCFLSFCAPDADSDEAEEFTDRLYFQTEGGATTSVVLVAQSQSVVRMQGVRISEDTELSSPRPYLIEDSLVVEAGRTLTLSAGVRMLFHPGAELIVHGRLLANGVAGAEVEMRGDRLGNMLSKVPYDNIPDGWGGVHFTSDSYGNELHFTNIHSGSYGLRLDSCDTSRQKLLMDCVTLHNVGGDALSARSCNVYAINSQITNAAGNCLTLLGGRYTFVHCTIAQFYPLVGGNGVALRFSNCDGDIRLPLDEMNFMNCIITGRSDDDIMGTPSERYRDLPFEYFFRSCLLNTPKIEGDAAVGHFENCLWENDDKEHRRSANFSPDFDYESLEFSFQLDSLSHAVDAADLQISNSLAPTDRLGRSRLQDKGPDMGCFERVEN